MSAEVWLGALQLCLQPSVILFLCIGVCIGTVIGALPGLSATMGIAIMTPITFWFEPADGFAMLMGLWNAAIFAGGISAILVNTPGTVDSDYRGEISAIVINLSNEPFTINDGERICQMVITRYTRVTWEPVNRIDRTERGDGAFGHTGVN